MLFIFIISNLLKLLLLVILLDFIRLWLFLSIVFLKYPLYYIYKEFYLWTIMHFISFYFLNMHNLNLYFLVISDIVKYNFLISYLEYNIYFSCDLFKIEIDLFLEILLNRSGSSEDHMLSNEYLYLVEDNSDYSKNSELNIDKNKYLYMAFEEQKREIAKAVTNNSQPLIRSIFKTGVLSWKDCLGFEAYLNEKYMNDPSYRKYLRIRDVSTNRNFIKNYQAAKGFYDYLIARDVTIKNFEFASEGYINTIKKYSTTHSYIDECIEENGVDNYSNLGIAETSHLKKLIKRDLLELNNFETKYKVFIVQYLAENPSAVREFAKNLKDYRCIMNTSENNTHILNPLMRNYMHFLFNGIEKKHACIIEEIDNKSLSASVITHYSGNNDSYDGISNTNSEYINKYLNPIILGTDKDGRKEFIIKPIFWDKGCVKVSDLTQRFTLYKYKYCDVSPEAMNRIINEEPSSIIKLINAPVILEHFAKKNN